MFPTTARPDAHWKHVDTYVAVKDNTCRIIGTKSIDKNTYPFEYPVIVARHFTNVP
jgi:hypothetical protein